LNPIEHIWAGLKVKINKRHPDLALNGRSEADLEALQDAIVECWRYINQYKINRLFEIINHRMRAVTDAQG